ncbi:hypothetical protein MJG53_008739 [Ovis ammon polii x Ovis aries]|uniref:Uncharacterized protein n=1 Tax=Ovis ammon polii x Ovis aries TaxID=2918886 RepID=A0ACB9V1C1_9CETA|nr:hypothetical protein MJG53_008739 [Ovis ammon polii x Ovis aries]
MVSSAQAQGPKPEKAPRREATSRMEIRIIAETPDSLTPARQDLVELNLINSHYSPGERDLFITLHGSKLTDTLVPKAFYCLDGQTTDESQGPGPAASCAQHGRGLNEGLLLGSEEKKESLANFPSKLCEETLCPLTPFDENREEELYGRETEVHAPFFRGNGPEDGIPQGKKYIGTLLYPEAKPTEVFNACVLNDGLNVADPSLTLEVTKDSLGGHCEKLAENTLQGHMILFGDTVQQHGGVKTVTVTCLRRHSWAIFKPIKKIGPKCLRTSSQDVEFLGREKQWQETKRFAPEVSQTSPEIPYLGPLLEPQSGTTISINSIFFALSTEGAENTNRGLDATELQLFEDRAVATRNSMHCGSEISAGYTAECGNHFDFCKDEY